jgi:dephospho-CoA kinase
MIEGDSWELSLPEAGDTMIVGITGGIASGKSTVAEMLAQLGAPIIDFDLLAREVVGPGEPAFREIVAYFGDGVIGEDGTLDRKRLSGIVFRDAERRKTLEVMTHPRILKAFGRQVRQLAEKDPRAIIQAVIPLLFEGHLEPLVHKVVVVYVSPETQIDRLMRRDQISREEAEAILDAQMPIDQKAGRADFLIRNEGDITETKKAVKALWQQLKETQRSRVEAG